MAPFDEAALRRSLDASERRITVSRQRKRQQTRALFLWTFGIVAAVSLVAAIAISRRATPSAPLLVVTWPKPKVRQVFKSGAAVLLRSGQPFDVEILGGENWQITWDTGDVESHAASIHWAPSGQETVIKARCKAVFDDWKRYFSWAQPARMVSLKAVEAKRKGDYQRTIETPESGVWVYPQIVTAGNVGWDERALPLLANAMDLVAAAALQKSAAELNSEPAPEFWRLASDFEGGSQKPPTDGATYAVRRGDDLEKSLPQIAAGIVKKSPSVSIKFVVRLDMSPPQGIVRLAFDGKRERRAWIRQPGQKSGGPLTGWEEGEVAGNLAPSLPR